MAKHYSLAIDGPAGAGKSTIAKRLAKELGYHYVDTGAIYRTLGYYFNLIGIGPKDIDGITKYIDECVIEIEWDTDGSQHMFLNEIDVSEEMDIISYTDAHSVSGWAMPAIQWACASGVISGLPDGNALKLDPQGTATRAQVATMMMNFCENIVK